MADDPKDWKIVGNKVLVKLHGDDKFSSGGIEIPDKYREGSDFATVVAVGGGLMMGDGERRPIGLQTGDVVVLGSDASGHMTGEYHVFDGEQYLFTRPRNILAKMESANAG